MRGGNWLEFRRLNGHDVFIKFCAEKSSTGRGGEIRSIGETARFTPSAAQRHR